VYHEKDAAPGAPVVRSGPPAGAARERPPGPGRGAAKKQQEKRDMLRCFLRGLAAAVLLCAAPAFSQTAATYPAKPIRIVIPLPPGGISDNMARLIAQKLQEAWRQPVVPENRPGGNHFIGAEIAARAAPDGYTLFFANHQTLAMNPGLFAKMPYDPVRDFVPVSLLVTSPNILVAHPSVPAKDLKELIEFARQKPGNINYGSQGTGSSGHVGMSMVEEMAGVKLTHIPYKGPAGATQDLLSGQLHVLLDTVFTQLGNIRSGKVKVLGVTGRQRAPLLPEVMTFEEQGLKDYEMLTWFGIVVPRGTPADIVAKINGELRRIMGDESVRQRLTDQGLVVVGSTPEAFQRHVESEYAKWTKTIRAMGVKPD
jgi:tripartite-type tricarboxylate transporter receptor subunit TctC